MVDVIGRAKVVITGDVDPTSIDKSSSKIGSALKKSALIGGAALGTLAVAGVKAFQSFEQGEASVRKLSNVLDNMGKAGATESLDDLASSLQRTTGVSDDTIRSGETLLATFSEVAKSAGETGGVFERATRASVDLAAAGFGNVESASKALGKALQDPLKGVTALSKAGVTFTEDQKKLIKGFVETGEVAKAQEVVLKEVEKQVEGTGEASATESAKIREGLGEVEEAVGGALAALAGDGKKLSLSDELFKLSDAITELGQSEDWKTFGKTLRTTARDGKIVADVLFNISSRVLKLRDVLGPLGSVFKLAFNPISAIIDIVGDFNDGLEDTLRWLARIKEAFNDSPITGPVNQGRDLTVEDFIGGSAGGGRIGPGLRLVGENGPEIIRAGSGGGYVHNNSETRAILASADGGGDTINNWNFFGPESLSQARREADWAKRFGTRFGAATSAAAL